MPENLTGLSERVTFHNPEIGFAVLRVKVKGRKDLVTVTGSTTSVTAGEHVEANGRWVIDRQHGQQFKAEELKTTHPASAQGIEKYLASGAIRSIGPKLAAKIVAVYHERTLEIFEKAPDFLLHVNGIGHTKNPDIRIAKSIVDYIFRWLGNTFLPGYREAQQGVRGEAGLGASGQLYNPWCLARESQGRIHIVDSGKDRVVRIRI